MGNPALAGFGETETSNSFGNTSGVDYTGDTQDTIPGLFDTPNRELHPIQGRWISPDPGGLKAANFSNPQTWNRYAYVTNMPLNTVDPQGLVGILYRCPGGVDIDGGCNNASDVLGFFSSGIPLTLGDILANTFEFFPDDFTQSWRRLPRANSIFSGQDCLTCFPLGPDPTQILQAALSGNLAQVRSRSLAFSLQ